MNLKSQLTRYWNSFSFAGLILAAFFFAASVTPSLLPRTYYAQGLLSGLAIAIGYGIGTLVMKIWEWLEVPTLSSPSTTLAKRLTALLATIVFCYFLWRVADWQNSIRELMEMPPIQSAYPMRMGLIALVIVGLLVTIARLARLSCRYLARKLTRLLPTRVAYGLSSLIVGCCALTLANDIFAKHLLTSADAFFLRWNLLVDDGIQQPTAALATGSSESLIPWEKIGRHGKTFVAGGPTQQQLSEFSQTTAMQPIRIYLGMRAATTLEQRAQLALDELKRVGAFERSVLVVATPTGTGWLDPNAVDTLEYLHAGDTAIVSVQYSYLPSWITLLVDPEKPRAAARLLFDRVYTHWKTLPQDKRPRLYLHGLSLGALGSESSADLFTLLEDPIQGALWAGPPFASTKWSSVTTARNSDSPAWLPTFRDGSLLRFTNQQNRLHRPQQPWGPMRCVYIQYASDPMVFFSPRLFWQKPDWLIGKRGPDVSPALTWYPIVTGLQIVFDLPMATSVPLGYGHNYSPANYIDAWVAVTKPPNWNTQKNEHLKRMFHQSP